MSAYNPLSLPESFGPNDYSDEAIIGKKFDFVYDSTLPPELTNLEIVADFEQRPGLNLFEQTPPQAGNPPLTC